MYFLVTVNYEQFIFDNAGTADSFAALAKNYIVNVDGKKDKVTTEYLTNEEAKEWLKD